MRTATLLLCGTLALAVPCAAAAAAPPATPGAAPPAAKAAAGADTPAAPGAPAAAPAIAEEPPSPATQGVSARREAPPMGLIVRGGYFGLPDTLADRLFRMHPKVSGSIYGAEFRYHGAGGGRSVGSIGVAIDRATTEANGLWQTDEFDEPWAASGKIDMTAITVTGYASILPSWPLHPFVGLGIGAAYLKGSYRKDDDQVNVDAWFPAVHIPVGLALELGDRFVLAAEARFIDGIAAGGHLEVRF